MKTLLLCAALVGMAGGQESKSASPLLSQNGLTISTATSTALTINAGPHVAIMCKEWRPKPSGCKIEKGKTLDDLVEAVISGTRAKDAEVSQFSQQTDYLLSELETCRAKPKKPSKP